MNRQTKIGKDATLSSRSVLEEGQLSVRSKAVGVRSARNQVEWRKLRNRMGWEERKEEKGEKGNGERTR